jgi:hypothetical protein
MYYITCERVIWDLSIDSINPLIPLIRDPINRCPLYNKKSAKVESLANKIFKNRQHNEIKVLVYYFYATFKFA